ncbi:MAG TPA: C4-dicarboxylate ABC transporter permease, partial [Syntrophorhabdus aromaticivorans]|nr:C4-dicarboxylate ABC transporter permease [Syntrophorhabdus aromaticivorans]
MFDLNALADAFKMMMSLPVLLAIPVGLFYSIIVGAIPGFTTSMAITTLLPLTYKLDPLSAIVILASAYGGAIYGGSITAILLRTPGTPASAATAIEGYALTQQGEANRALGLSTTASSVGSAFSYLFVFFLMVPISWFALRFSSPELFAVAVFGITLLAVIGKGGLAKGLAAGFFGFLLGLVGMTAYGQTRATFGRVELIEGFPTVPVLIGLLAFSQVFAMMEQKFIVQEGKEFEPNYRDMLKASVETLKDWFNLIRSSLIGTFVGLMPAAGSSIAAFISYNEAARSSKTPFGKGNPAGIIAAEAANNASEGGAMATMLSLGIPGSPSSAIIMGALLVHGIRPGPRLFIPKDYDPYSGMTFVYAIILTQIIAAILMFPMGLMMSKGISRVIKVETKFLAPLIAFLCVVGSFASRNFVFDAAIMVVFGLIGFIFAKFNYPPVAVVLGIILGPIADAELMRSAMLYFGNPWMIFTRPIVIVLSVI